MVQSSAGARGVSDLKRTLSKSIRKVIKMPDSVVVTPADEGKADGEAEATEPVTAPVRRDPYREAAARRELAMDRVVFIAEAKRLQLFDELAAVKGHASRTEALRWAIEHAIEAWLLADEEALK